MKLSPSQQERLAFLCRITQKEIKHLQDTDRPSHPLALLKRHPRHHPLSSSAPL